MYTVSQVVNQDYLHRVLKRDAHRTLAEEHVQSSRRASRRTANIPQVLRLNSLRAACARGNAAGGAAIQVLDGDIVARHPSSTIKLSATSRGNDTEKTHPSQVHVCVIRYFADAGGPVRSNSNLRSSTLHSLLLGRGFPLVEQAAPERTASVMLGPGAKMDWKEKATEDVAEEVERTNLDKV
jgi:hypothetical protein